MDECRLTFERAGNNTPLARRGAAAASIHQYSVDNSQQWLANDLPIVGQGDGKSLYQISAISAHAWPQGQIAGLRVVRFGQNERGVRLANP